jgi:cytochrome P450
MSVQQAAVPSDGPLLEAYDAIAAAGGDPKAIALQELAYIRQQILTNALPFFDELRRLRPILVSPLATVVASFRDVEEILHRETIFSVKGYVPHMTGVIGPFILSLDLTPAYDHDKAAMKLVVRRDDLDRVRQITAQAASEAVASAAAAAGGQPFDIVQAVTRKTPVRLAAEYYGFGADDDAQVMAWARACFWEFFQNLDNNPQVRQGAVDAGAAMTARARALIDAARAGEGPEDTVLMRLLAQQFAGPGLGFDDDDGIVRTLMGLVIGMVETTSQAAVQALLVLFSKPAALAGAAAAAAADNDDLLWAHILEALRFAPVNPLVMRILNADYTLAAGEPREKLLPAGTLVFACTWSAMFDEAILEAPQTFQAGRPAWQYLHFATGEHACFGRYISQVQVTQILKAILRLKGLAPAGPPTYAGPFPDKLLITGAPAQ